MPIQKPSCYREMTSEEMSFDGGGSKIPWWGWTLIGVVAAGALIGIGFGIKHLCSSSGAAIDTAGATGSAPTGNMYDLEIVPLNNIQDTRALFNLQKQGFQVHRPLYGEDGSVYFSLIRKR